MRVLKLWLAGDVLHEAEDIDKKSDDIFISSLSGESS